MVAISTESGIIQPSNQKGTKMFKILIGIAIGYLVATYSVAEMADCCAATIHKISSISIQIKGV